MFIYNGNCFWCENELTDFCLTAKDKNKNQLKFCDLVCAKHYNDIKEKIDVNMEKYTNLYLNNKLGKQAARIFQVVSKKGFEFMPTIYNTQYDEDKHKRREMAQNYINTIYKCR